ncbi:MAG TPA: hypothetical protein VL199_06855 [Burkholderiales bacterium]|jgi:hypothetical protein|nr:hypothetical protein [Burkholderiales bacterium]
MKTITALLLCFATAVCLADDANTSGKKAEKKAKPAAKSDKNFAQRAESSTGKFLRDNKIWTKSESRGTGTSDKKAKKTN